MDTETIDLTDPFKEMLRYQRLSGERLSKRISDLACKRKSDGSNSTENIRMEDLLDRSCEITSTPRMNLPFSVDETIILSDDDEPEPSEDFCRANTEDLSEIQVIEFTDESSDDQNEDDIFEEVSITRIPYSQTCMEQAANNTALAEQRPVNSILEREPKKSDSEERAKKSSEKLSNDVLHLQPNIKNPTGTLARLGFSIANAKKVAVLQRIALKNITTTKKGALVKSHFKESKQIPAQVQSNSDEAEKESVNSSVTDLALETNFHEILLPSEVNTSSLLNYIPPIETGSKELDSVIKSENDFSKTWEESDPLEILVTQSSPNGSTCPNLKVRNIDSLIENSPLQDENLLDTLNTTDNCSRDLIVSEPASKLIPCPKPSYLKVKEYSSLMEVKSNSALESIFDDTSLPETLPSLEVTSGLCHLNETNSVQSDLSLDSKDKPSESLIVSESLSVNECVSPSSTPRVSYLTVRKQSFLLEDKSNSALDASRKNICEHIDNAEVASVSRDTFRLSDNSNDPEVEQKIKNEESVKEIKYCDDSRSNDCDTLKSQEEGIIIASKLSEENPVLIGPTKSMEILEVSLTEPQVKSKLVSADDETESLGHANKLQESEEVTKISEPEPSSINLEEIRKDLRRQLTFLRTKKKNSILLDFKQTLINDRLPNKESTCLSSDQIHPVPSKKPFKPVIDVQCADTINIDSSRSEGDVQIPNSIPILEVPKETERIQSQVEPQESEDIPNVFNEIRKIIRKQKSLPIRMERSIISEIVPAKPNYNESSNDSPDFVQDTSSSPQVDKIETPSCNQEAKSTECISSPFVSNSLDEFLTDSQLNVSYAIPKSGAEEGLRSSYPVDPLHSIDSDIKKENSEKSKKKSTYKPKTLAEKRKILEKKKKLEEKKLSKLRELEKLQSRSYVLFKNKKIFVRSNSRGRCISSVGSTSYRREKLNYSSSSKPSLLKEYYKSNINYLKYKPGPLSKKYLLQSDYTQWTSELKSLPTPVLEIRPELGKPIHPVLLPHILRQWDGEVSKEQLEFALAAVVEAKPSSQEQIFHFDLKYQRHLENLLIRKKKGYTPVLPVSSTKVSTADIDNKDISSILNDLITYVEIKELAQTLIKEPEVIKMPEEELVHLESPLQPSKKEPPKKKSRTSRELLRLNCKVVNVDVKLDNTKTKCSKPHCRLGCLCESLKCSAIIGVHCRKASCLFGCKCPKESNSIISIPHEAAYGDSNTNFLSMDTVSRIEDHAKKNLAKVEKEFTQTIIYANDNAIVVGSSSKPRRVTKTPKKYTDFFEDDLYLPETVQTKSPTKLIKPCTIALERCDFSEVIPYCLVHFLYNCHCKGYSSFPSIAPKPTNKQQSPNTLGMEKNKAISESSIKATEKKRPDSFSDDQDSDIYPVAKKRKKCSNQSLSTKEEGTCSRTRCIGSKYFKVKKYSDRTCMDWCHNVKDGEILKVRTCPEDKLNDCIRMKREIDANLRGMTEKRKAHPRKQRLEIRRDDLFIDIQDKPPVRGPKRNVAAQSIMPIFPGEIIIHDFSLVSKLCNNSKMGERYARILPWSALIKGFSTGSINVYCICTMPFRLVLNVGPKLKGRKALDVQTTGHQILELPVVGNSPALVKQSENVRDIIRWLLSGVLSAKYMSTSLSFLLVETVPGEFEIRGLCTQVVKNAQSPEPSKEITPLASKETKDKIAAGQESVIKTEVIVKNEADDNSSEVIEIKHKNVKNAIATLFATKKKFPMRELIEDGKDDDLEDNLYMWVGLPDVYKMAKWRVIFLKNDFVYLIFKTIQYSIRYTDLVKLTEMARDAQQTLVVRNEEIQRNHSHCLFGIYVSQKYSDRIFIGPYFINYDSNDIDTLKSISGMLVSSESLVRITSRKKHVCGNWMFERNYAHLPKAFSTESSPVAKDVETLKVAKTEQVVEMPSTQKQDDFVPPSTSSDCQLIHYNGFTVNVKTCKPRKPSEFNRYIITNIPHFGYLGAFQPDNSTILEVSWPFEKKVLQFENADHARDFLQERFNQLLQPVPETFKIQVIVLVQLDLNEYQPINSDYLNGHCICGYFGAYNFKNLSEEFCITNLNMSRQDITFLFAKRAHDFIRKKLQELAEINGISPSNSEEYNVLNILEKAKAEIKYQEQLRLQLIADIQLLEAAVVSKVKRIFGGIKKLPSKHRSIESRILSETLQFRPKRLMLNEVIDISDDDGPPVLEPAVDNKIENEAPSSPNCPKLCPQEELKQKEPATTICRSPKVAKIAPFSSKPVDTTSEILESQSDKLREDSQLCSNESKVT
ncbi:uncharacterized protein ocm isoform X2 [Euwallacea fornicatus]|uniref:uncharacterized protein ocm isoform X2 n=1 Tax=Euwallacea fornicatus TaxID=995702 RepID=UPI00338DE8ED